MGQKNPPKFLLSVYRSPQGEQLYAPHRRSAVMSCLVTGSTCSTVMSCLITGATGSMVVSRLMRGSKQQGRQPWAGISEPKQIFLSFKYFLPQLLCHSGGGWYSLTLLFYRTPCCVFSPARCALHFPEHPGSHGIALHPPCLFSMHPIV